MFVFSPEKYIKSHRQKNNCPAQAAANSPDSYFFVCSVLRLLPHLLLMIYCCQHFLSQAVEKEHVESVNTREWPEMRHICN